MAAVIFLFVVGQTICSTFPGPPSLIYLNHCIAVFFNNLHVMVVHSNSMTPLKGVLGASKSHKTTTKYAKKCKTMSKIVENQNCNVCVAS